VSVTLAGSIDMTLAEDVGDLLRQAGAKYRLRDVYEGAELNQGQPEGLCSTAIVSAVEAQRSRIFRRLGESCEAAPIPKCATCDVVL
jgi:hypothetical protein